MSSAYERIISSRLDMSDWMIHFTRCNNGEHPRDTLIKILSDGMLLPGWGMRNGRPTVFGPHPAVCFTEQPLWAFLRYLDARSDVTEVSGYGVHVHKHDLYAEGALPVISGLHARRELEVGEPGFEQGKRILDPSILPYVEQYRYVQFNPNRMIRGSKSPNDWTHEREWRLSKTGNSHSGGAFRLRGWGHHGDRGSSEGRTIVMVPTVEEAETVRQQLQPIMQAGDSTVDDYRCRWLQHLNASVKFLVLERAREQIEGGQNAYARMEKWPGFQTPA